MIIIKEYINLIKEIENKIYYKDGNISKTSLWSKIPKPVKNILENDILKPEIINNEEYYRISRHNVFNLKPKGNHSNSIHAFYSAIMMWGYPTGGRGNNVKNVLENIDNINKQYKNLITVNGKCDLDIIYKNLLSNHDYKINSMGPSTFTKVLYFIEFHNNKGIKSIILDDIMIRIFKSDKIFEIEEFKKKTNKIKVGHTPEFYKIYCEFFSEITNKYEISLFGLEYFLFYICRTLGEMKI